MLYVTGKIWDEPSWEVWFLLLDQISVNYLRICWMDTTNISARKNVDQPLYWMINQPCVTLVMFWVLDCPITRPTSHSSVYETRTSSQVQHLNRDRRQRDLPGWLNLIKWTGIALAHREEKTLFYLVQYRPAVKTLTENPIICAFLRWAIKPFVTNYSTNISHIQAFTFG